MRRYLLLFILLASVASQAQTKVQFDKFKNVTRFASEETASSSVTYDGGKDVSILVHSMSTVVAFHCEGQVDRCQPATIELLFIAHTSDWQMHGKNEVTLLIDGKPVIAGKADWDGQVLEAENLVEYNDTNISPGLLVKLAGAKKVDVQIGVFEFSLTDKNFVAIRDIATHLK
jgi:hypothetical protein